MKVNLDDTLNPWRNLDWSSKRFLLPEDQGEIEHFNNSVSDSHRIHDELVPLPYMGRIDAPVVILNLNPGYSPQDIVDQSPEFVEQTRQTLLHEQMDYPFFLLDPSLPTSGGNWWNKRLRLLIEETSRNAVAQNVLVLEWFPYHSYKFKAPRSILKSQEYTFQLARQAIARQATIILFRAGTRWTHDVPELKGYELMSLDSHQSVYLTPNNSKHSGAFVKAVDAIQHSSR